MSEPKEADNKDQEREDVFADEMMAIGLAGQFDIPVKEKE